MAETHEEIDCYIELYWADRMEAILEEEEAVEDAERRKRGSGGELKKKRRTTAGVGSSKKEDDNEDPVEESGNEDGAAAESIRQAKSDLARKKKALNAKIARFEGMKKTVEGRKTMTEEDVAVAAAYRAKGEEAHRNKDRKGELAAVIEWIATGDPEAIGISDQWMAENVEDMKLEPKDPTDWAAIQAKDYREFWESLRAGPPFPFPGRTSNRYLTLTGPTRAVVVVDPVYLEVDLRVKGRTESEDRALSYLGVNCRETGCSESYMFKCVETSKLSTVELTLGDMAESVEATISVKVVDEEWPEGFGGLISARTASISDMEIKLLAFDKLPVAADGTIQLSRRVVSVEARGMLRVSVMPNCLDDRTVEGVSIAFKAREASRSTQMLEVCSCKLEVTIAWSLVTDMV
ncbi:hypothetical protein ZWY2020_037218 [Hordeum vulgare]|nr:hypothetical protein ZWY2020_037218 [Hordeum vulgare]